MKRLKDWQIRLKPDSSEGYCWQQQKIIDLGLENPNPLRLLLHEVAHIDNDPHGNKHNQNWFNEYIKLMRKYMPTVDISESDKIIKETYELNEKTLKMSDADLLDYIKSTKMLCLFCDELKKDVLERGLIAIDEHHKSKKTICGAVENMYQKRGSWE